MFNHLKSSRHIIRQMAAVFCLVAIIIVSLGPSSMARDWRRVQTARRGHPDGELRVTLTSVSAHQAPRAVWVIPGLRTICFFSLSSCEPKSSGTESRAHTANDAGVSK